MHEISIIIPTRNEEFYLAQTLNRLRDSKECEILVVDGQSADQTIDVAQSFGARVVSTSPGRGHQLNVGAREANAEILLFLHADTQLPVDFATHVHRILDKPGVVAGAFQLAINSRRRSLRVVEAFANWRSKALQLPYGDQAIFLRRQTLSRIGEFPDQPAMEDFELIRRLRRIGRIDIASAGVETSPRRWDLNGVWRTTVLNQICVAAYLSGVTPDAIASWRRTGDLNSADIQRSTLTSFSKNDLIKVQQ